MNDRERFIACMEYQPADRRPNHERGVQAQTRARWEREQPDAVHAFTWNWPDGEAALGMDRRAFIPVHYGLLPPTESDAPAHGAPATGTWPVQRPEDFAGVRRHMQAAVAARYPQDFDAHVAGWLRRDCPLSLGACRTAGFYRRARELMGVEALSLAWHDAPGLMHEMMGFFADFLIETSRPVLEKIRVDYFTINEDLAVKGGPLLSPDTFRTFVLPPLKRLVEFLREHGTRYVAVDTDGNPAALIPLLMEAGVDTLWPVDRSADVSPQEWRRRFGPSLRLWGGVDARVLTLGAEAVRAHLREFIPLIEEGGFIPAVDRAVPPDVSWDPFRVYMELKRELLAGNFAALGA